jgi:ADP-ribose pyrophosphatase YjhB (NUDIX family)
VSDQVLYRLSAAVFAEPGANILLLKRATAVLTGQRYLPRGAVDPVESGGEAARRELLEESGLAPLGPLRCVAVADIYVYGHAARAQRYGISALPSIPIWGGELFGTQEPRSR